MGLDRDDFMNVLQQTLANMDYIKGFSCEYDEANSDEKNESHRGFAIIESWSGMAYRIPVWCDDNEVYILVNGEKHHMIDFDVPNILTTMWNHAERIITHYKVQWRQYPDVR